MIDPRPLMPSVIYILGIPYQVVAMQDDEKVQDATIEVDASGEEVSYTVKTMDGFINFDRERIEIDMDSPNYSLMVTLLHEVLHGCLNPVNKDNDEELVNALSHVLLDTLRRNPELVKFLMAGTK